MKSLTAHDAEDCRSTLPWSQSKLPCVPAHRRPHSPHKRAAMLGLGENGSFSLSFALLYAVST